jgi:chromosome segregation protein
MRGHGLQGVDERLRALAAGSGVRSAKFETLFEGLQAESSPLETWDTVLTELERLILLDHGDEFTTQMTPTLSRLALTLGDQQKLRVKMTVDSWLDLALTPIEDRPVFQYQTKEKEYIPFEAASAGQQATALLKVLLSQTGMPLIIDQPEEDLDSQVIQDVVSWLWESKGRRQVIFASHNANLVVNGDAELVAACDYRRAGDQSGARSS